MKIARLFSRLLTLALPCLLFAPANAQSSLPTPFWPEGQAFDKSVVTPKQHFGFDLGFRHLRHDQLESYIKAIAAKSDRFKLVEYGKTHGGRPLLLAVVTSPANHKKLEQLRRKHLQLTQHDRSSQSDLESIPVVINMGYGVHGDEPSASNSAVLVAHYLAAAQGARIEKMLDNMVILLDPCLNPDGFDRFAKWVNTYRGKTPNADPAHAEHNQSWPAGRVNYYWFDLNRDWLPLVHPESRGRMRWYHRWKPDVVLDFHEMGTASTYFFQPGIPERTNPLTPKRNVELTKKIATYHAKVLDQAGTLFMTEELFDDFYMGKGSTYPDLHGAVGILFEQSSSRGHVQENPFGKLRFPDTIHNQFRTSLSSLNATFEMKNELLKFKRNFYQQANQRAAAQKHKTIVFTAGANRARLQGMADMLRRHDIQCYWPKKKLQYGDQTFWPGNSLIVPIEQKEFRFLQSLLDRRTNFQENIFYDVSSWTLPYAYGVNEQRLVNSIPTSELMLAQVGVSHPRKIRFGNNDIAYLVDWRNDLSARLLSQLLRQGIKVQVAQKPFTIGSGKNRKRFGYGTLSIALGIQKKKTTKIRQLLSSAAKAGVSITPVESSLTTTGIDLGSGKFPVIDMPNIAMLIGTGTSQYQVGEIWHLFDNQLRFPVTLLKARSLHRVDLSRYEKLILVGPVDEFEGEQIADWVEKGGTLIAIGSALSSIDKLIVERELLAGEESEAEEKGHQHLNHLQKSFVDRQSDRALKQIAGAIFNTQVDGSHPLCYGIDSSNLSVFRNRTSKLMPNKSPYNNPLIYGTDSLLAGYASEENVRKLKNSASITVDAIGKGRVISMVDDPVFRGYFRGTEKLLINAAFFGHLSTRSRSR